MRRKCTASKAKRNDWQKFLNRFSLHEHKMQARICNERPFQKGRQNWYKKFLCQTFNPKPIKFGEFWGKDESLINYFGGQSL